jgi:hypothetical protein
MQYAPRDWQSRLAACAEAEAAAVAAIAALDAPSFPFRTESIENGELFPKHSFVAPTGSHSPSSVMPLRSTTALFRLQENHDAFMERSKTDKKFADEYLQLQEDLKRQHANREQRSEPGRQRLDRTRVAADTPKRQQRDGAEDLSGGKRVRIIYGDDAVLQLRERIWEHGLKSGDYVQIANDSGQKWFMRIVNGEVLFKDTDNPALASALWCEENDVTKLSSVFTRAETCEIRCIIDAGPVSKFNVTYNRGP